MNCTDWNTFHSLEDVNASYHRFLDSEYNNGSHSSIGMTPKERYLKDFDSLRFLEKTAVEEGFLHRITRKVTPTATVSLFNISYEVPQQYIGCTIHLRYRPEEVADYTRDRMKLCGVSEEIFEVAALGDRFWNREQLERHMSRTDAITISEALNVIKEEGMV